MKRLYHFDEKFRPIKKEMILENPASPDALPSIPLPRAQACLLGTLLKVSQNDVVKAKFPSIF